MSYSKVLVTGGAGFIGSYLVDALIADECRITVLDNLSTGKTENISRHLECERLHFVKSDILDLEPRQIF